MPRNQRRQRAAEGLDVEGAAQPQGEGGDVLGAARLELVEEPQDVSRDWRNDLVGFLIGCSFTFENALLAAGVPLRHIEQGVNVPMYRTNIACKPAGRFSGPPGIVDSCLALTRTPE